MSIFASVPAPAGSRLIDADTIDLSAHAVGRFPVNPAYRPQDTADRARQAWDAIQTNSNATVAQVAGQLGITADELYHLALHYIAVQTGWTAGQKRQAVVSIPADPPLCPAWCTVDHTEDGAERLHSHEVAEVVAPSGPDMHDQQSISVNLDAFESPELPGGIDLTSIYLVTRGEDSEVTASLSPELAEQLAAALFEAARIARQARG